MHPEKTSLAALIGSRICHDLINPIGAISNGLELVAMTGPATTSPEMTLIQQSCDNATARIRFFRIAFGSVNDMRIVPSSAARKTVLDHYDGTRITPQWDIHEDLSRRSVQLGYLAVLCLEVALPQGGTVSVSLDAGDLKAVATGPTVTEDAALWDMLTDRATEAGELRPAHVQFALLARILGDLERVPETRFDGEHAEIVIALH